MYEALPGQVKYLCQFPWYYHDTIYLIRYYHDYVRETIGGYGMV